MPVATRGRFLCGESIMKTDEVLHPEESNRDPVSGAPGAHPVGVGLGTVVGGVAAGATLGTIAGPVGSVAGAVVGGILGALGGKAFAETLDPTLQDQDDYWRDQYVFESYVDQGRSYEDYRYAYRVGYETRVHYPHMTEDEAMDALQSVYEREADAQALPWAKARYATRAAWHRADAHLREHPEIAPLPPQ